MELLTSPRLVSQTTSRRQEEWGERERVKKKSARRMSRKRRRRKRIHFVSEREAQKQSAFKSTGEYFGTQEESSKAQRYNQLTNKNFIRIKPLTNNPNPNTIQHLHSKHNKTELAAWMKSKNNVLPVELIQAILLRVPARYLFRLRLVSKLWFSLISNPDFVELHLHRSSSLTSPAFFFAKSSEQACLVDLHALFIEDATIGAALKDVSIPFVKKKKHRFKFLDHAEDLYCYTVNRILSYRTQLLDTANKYHIFVILTIRKFRIKTL
ncbi:hypothetical protein PIB30_091768 [Stylosanthes scabra]|uniref:F-box domain-containing protein n=1 Tax=Stylosanthes scabra TaxID=79078 RepID=A0ABU6QUI9_9FABA|nr:hypothetical protein [Stylosanthes scabra]